MLSCLLDNLQLIGVLILMYVGSLGANTLLGLYNNINNLKENFSPAQFACKSYKFQFDKPS